MKFVFICESDDLFILGQIAKLKNAVIFTKYIYPDPWKHIVDNQLFSDEDSICFLDETISMKQIEYLNRIYKQDYDIISFTETNDPPFVNEEYLKQHDLPLLHTWWPTMNHCIKRNLLVDFVNFYYYTREGYNLDPTYVLSAFTSKCKRYVLKTPYALCCGKSIDLVQNINEVSPETNVICCRDQHYSKPQMIYELLSVLEQPATLLYMGTEYRFDNTYPTLYEDLSIIKAWKTSETANPEHLAKLFVEPFDMFSTDFILFDVKPETVQIVRQWVELCKQYPEMSDSFLFSLLLKIYS